MNLSKHLFPTPIGSMTAIADERFLYFLAFSDSKNIDANIEKLLKRHKATLVMDLTAPLTSIEDEITAYFTGKLTHFKTTLFLTGSPFQQVTWQKLTTIPYGITQSYRALAHAIEKPSAHRAVANANRLNNLAIIIPCHRIIKANGDLCGYNGSIERKRWLLDHEKRK